MRSAKSGFCAISLSIALTPSGIFECCINFNNSSFDALNPSTSNAADKFLSGAPSLPKTCARIASSRVLLALRSVAFFEPPFGLPDTPFGYFFKFSFLFGFITANLLIFHCKCVKTVCSKSSDACQASKYRHLCSEYLP